MCADRLNVTKGNIAQHLKNLEKRGLMRREKIGRDNNLYLTDEGWDLFLTNMPIAIGMTMMTMSWMMIFGTSNETTVSCPIILLNANCTMSGIVTIVMRLLIAVRVTDRAASPFER